MWTNTREVKVLEEQKGNLSIVAYVAKWDRKHDEVFAVDTQRFCRIHYTYRFSLIVNDVVFETYGKTTSSPNNENFSRKENVLKRVKKVAQELGFEGNITEAS